jgi:hypothetical protein
MKSAFGWGAALFVAASTTACGTTSSPPGDPGNGDAIRDGGNGDATADATANGDPDASFSDAARDGTVSDESGRSPAVVDAASAADGARGADARATGSDASGDGPVPGVDVLVNPAPGSKLFVGANFWNIDWEGSSDFFESGVDFTTAANPWKPQLLTDLAPYHVLRFMDWNLTNDSNNPQAVWTTRTQKTQAQGEPVAFEWQVDLCNRAKKDYWLNVPHEANSAYWTSLAELVNQSLDPSLRVYVEWSNEVWNSGFPAHDYAASKAASLSLPGSDPAAAFYVYQAVRMYEAFEAVFGAGSPRLVKVLAGQAAWTGPCGWHAAALKDATINPRGTRPDVYAIAPYFSGTSIAALRSAIPTTAGWTSDQVTCAAGMGLPLVSYEGGSDSFAAAGNGCATLQTDPGMHDLYTSYLDAQAGAGLTGPFMQDTHAGTCWGLVPATGTARASSPKYQGVVDWLATHP